MEAGQEEMEAAVFEERLNRIDTTDLEANPEEKESLAEQLEAPNEETEVGTVGALEDHYGVRFLVVGHCCKLKKGTQGDDGPRKKLSVTQERLTRHYGRKAENDDWRQKRDESFLRHGNRQEGLNGY
jgi:hypothetical protein